MSSDRFEEIIEEVKSKIRDPTADTNKVLFHILSEFKLENRNNVRLIQYLLRKSDIDINYKGRDGLEPILCAACKNKTIHLDIISLLIDKGYDMYGRFYDRSIFEYACIYSNNKHELIKLFIDKGYDVNKIVGGDKDNALTIACGFQIKLETIELILEKITDFNYVNDRGYNALIVAILNMNPNIDILKLLLEHSNADTLKYISHSSRYATSNITSYNAFQIACANSYKCLETVKLLYKKYKELDITSELEPKPNRYYHMSLQRLVNSNYNISESNRLKVLEFLESTKVFDKTKFEMKDVPITNAYKLLKVEHNASGKQIRENYLKLRKKYEKGEKMSSSSSSEKSLRRVTAAYNLLKDRSLRSRYDEVVDKPKRKLLQIIQEKCFNDQMDPIVLVKYEKMSVEELRRVYVLYPNEYYLLEEANHAGKGFCINEESLKTLVKDSVSKNKPLKNPLTRETFDDSVLRKLKAKFT